MKTQIFTFMLVAAFTTVAHAATYQTIFNNVEQGAGGSASPSISVNGQAVRKNGLPVIAESSPVVEAPVSSMESVDVDEVAPASFYRFRFLAAGSRVTQSAGSAWSSTQGDLRGLRDMQGGATASLALTIQASRDIGFTGFWIAPGATGRQALGAEMEFIPIRVAVLGNTDFIEIGGLLGGSTLGKETVEKAGTLHAGARLNVNFHDQLGITGAARSNFTDRRTYRFAQGEIGLTYRF